MPGPYCERCQCTVLLEQDGKSCSNCGSVIVGPSAKTKQRTTNPDPPQLSKEKRQAIADTEAEIIATAAAKAVEEAEAADELRRDPPEPEQVEDKAALQRAAKADANTRPPREEEAAEDTAALQRAAKADADADQSEE